KGFKSFASSTTLHFEPGVTCVVGPNGSGKSNVVDALAWVMGEQGAKSLRGGKMEDVIFSGTSGRAPLGRAEVSLTIDNSDGALPIEYTEVTISRILFRNGGSEYAINGQACRLLDVQELLSDSGIGREMHVIVGQGQLDTILQATPEDRRGFIEEAAGVLKHRKRKEKALRKLDSMEANLTRLQDLTTELRRQLKPLGRQAEVARRAVVIQTDVRDSRLRIMADDLVQMREALAAEVADESALRDRQITVEASLTQLREQETAAEQEALADAPRLERAQETWFSVNGLRERFHGLVQLAAERVRNLQPEPVDEHPGRDPEQLDAEARGLRSQEFELGREVEAARDGLSGAANARQGAEEALAAEERRVATAERAAADRREGLVRLTGQVNAAQSRVEARAHELERLRAAISEAKTRSEQAMSEFQSIEVQVAGLDEGELGLDARHEDAESALAAADAEVERLRGVEARSERERAALSARLEALSMSLMRKDAGGVLVAEGDRLPGMLGTLASQLHIASGAQAAVAAILGDLADAVVVRGVEEAVTSLILLKERDAGRAALVIASHDHLGSATVPGAPPVGRWLREHVTCEQALSAAVDRFLNGVVLVDDVEQAAAQSQLHPEFTFVTPVGDIFARDVVHGGSQSTLSLLEVQAAYDETSTALQQAVHASERARFDMVAARQTQAQAAAQVEATLSGLHESDARMAAVAEQLGQLGQIARSASAEVERLASALAAGEIASAADVTQHDELVARLAAAHSEPDTDLGVDQRDELGQQAVAARAYEVEARLSLRTGEERLAAVGIRADQLERAAASERESRVAAVHRREQRARDLTVAVAVLTGARAALARTEASVAIASNERTAAERLRKSRDETLTGVRGRIRELAVEFDLLKDSVHR
ncbi:MAG TPA: chromosome segregation protein SMC, partial [Actinobacteria bacterium]|nr:chromosome segregation protein SMC [Actinomycetota bacterium]